MFSAAPRIQRLRHSESGLSARFLPPQLLDGVGHRLVPDSGTLDSWIRGADPRLEGTSARHSRGLRRRSIDHARLQPARAGLASARHDLDLRLLRDG